MHIPRLLRSESSRPQAVPQAGSGNAGPLAPKHSFHIPKFLSFGRSRSQAPPQAAASSSLPSLNPVASRQDIPDTSGSPPSHCSQSATSFIELDTAQELDIHRSVTPHAVHHASPSQTADSVQRQRQDLLVMPSLSSASVSQQSLLSLGQTYSPQPQDGNFHNLRVSGDIRMIQESRNVTVDGNNNNVNYTNTVVNSPNILVNNPNKFMVELLQETIQGAAFDSSARDPPPRCHPGTRLAVIARCLEFIANATGERKLRWVVGQAGVGKSAIMQNVAESRLLSVSQRASIFLSINGRNDGSKIIMTLIYQLADRCEPYRQFVEHEITHHPSLLQSSMSVQFKTFIIEPFVNTPLWDTVSRILIIIDGLDECKNWRCQREVLRLISDACSTYQSSPIVWIVASRPEAHITSFFDQDHIQGVYEKEVIEVDSDEARSDVERFLRAEMMRIQKEFSLSPRSQWPPEQDFWELASASGGLFAFAQTVVNYIGDPEVGDPASQLGDVLTVIEARPLPNVPREQHPLALLDALYTWILLKIPERIMPNTRRVLLALVMDSNRADRSREGGFLVLCNWLGMTCDEAYAAIRHLSSVLSVPRHDEAHEKKLRPFHKSFIDYISDFARSGFSSDIEHEARQLEVQYTMRILGQAPDGIDCGDRDDDVVSSSASSFGALVSVPGAGSDIMLTWSTAEDSSWGDSQTRMELYKWALANVLGGIKTRDLFFCNEYYIRIMTSRLRYIIPGYFRDPHLLDLFFDKPRCHKFIRDGILKRVPVKELEFTRMKIVILRFRRPSGIRLRLSNPWNPSCVHKRTGEWGTGKDKDWTTSFSVNTRHSGCSVCSQRLEEQLENWKTRFPDQDALVLFTAAQISVVEFHFIDPDDGRSEWNYRIVYLIEEEKRRELGSTL